jgi:amidase
MFYGTDGGRSFRKYLAEVGMNELPALLELSLTRALAHEKSNEECEALRKSWHSLHAHLRRFMQRYDLILCPVATGPAPLHGATAREDPMQLFSYSMTFNLTMLPAVTVRAGTSPEGLPIGVQVVARPWREDVALSAAQAIETALGPWPQPRVAAQARDSESTF